MEKGNLHTLGRWCEDYTPTLHYTARVTLCQITRPGLYSEHSAQVASFIIPSSHYQPSPPTEETQWLSLAGNHSRTMYFTVSSFHFHPFVRSICIQRNGSYLKVFGWMVLLFSFLLLIQGNVAVLYLASGEKLGYWTEKRQEILLWIQTKLSRT